MSSVLDEPALPIRSGELHPLAAWRGSTQARGIRQRFASAVAGFLQGCLGPRSRGALGILMYHRVCDPVAGHPAPTWNVSRRRLEDQLAGLLARGWQPWPLRQVLECRQRNLPIPRKTFVVTFDDGYANNLLHALPILVRLRVPATVFLATAYLDSPHPFPSDDWPAAGKPGVPSECWRPLTTAECRRLAASGLVELGAHTHTHADFRGRPELLAADLRKNVAVLRERFGVERPAFAFPYGIPEEGFASRDLSRIAEDLGLPCSLTTEDELVGRGASPFTWGRLAVGEHHTARALAGWLGGWYTALRRTAKRRR